MGRSHPIQNDFIAKTEHFSNIFAKKWVGGTILIVIMMMLAALLLMVVMVMMITTKIIADNDYDFHQTGGGSCYTVKQEKCMFPFQYKGQQFTQCTTVGIQSNPTLKIVLFVHWCFYPI